MTTAPVHPFVLAQDDDAHWYVVPRSRLPEWSAWLDAGDHIDGPPDYADPVGGAPGNVTFRLDGTYSIR